MARDGRFDEEVRSVGFVVAHLVDRGREVPAHTEEGGRLTGCEELHVGRVERVARAVRHHCAAVVFAGDDPVGRPSACESHTDSPPEANIALSLARSAAGFGTDQAGAGSTRAGESFAGLLTAVETG